MNKNPSSRCLAASAPPLCHAARPFVTDDARVVDPDHCQLETFYKEQRSYSGHEFWFLPACNKLGVEWTIAGNRIEGDEQLHRPGKKLFEAARDQRLRARHVVWLVRRRSLRERHRQLLLPP